MHHPDLYQAVMRKGRARQAYREAGVAVGLHGEAHPAELQEQNVRAFNETLKSVVPVPYADRQAHVFDAGLSVLTRLAGLP